MKSYSPTSLEYLLQGATNVEFWTIPLYLTAAYSIKPAAKQTNPGMAETITETLMSVAVQEMLHLQLAGDLALAFGVAPTLNMSKSSYGNGVPHITGPGVPSYTSLGNVQEVIDLLIYIETPDASGNPPTTPSTDGNYNSIGDMYNVLKIMADKQWSKPHNVDRQLDNYTFKTRYGLKPITDKTGVDTAINIVVEQGEGTQEAKCPHTYNPSVPDFARPAPSRFSQYDDISHYERFVDIKKDLKKYKIALYKGTKSAPASNKYQSALNVAFSKFIYALEDVYNGVTKPGKMDYGAMYFMQELITKVWEGGYRPYFQKSATRPTAAAYKKALATADTDDLYHWSKLDQKLKSKQSDPTKAPFVFHSCQGLNSCKGQGHNGSGTTVGDGACATVNPHTCSNGNSCKYQGGCGYSPFLPAGNPGTGDGGCQAPISPYQAFDPTGIPHKSSLAGYPVWLAARENLAHRHSTTIDKLPAPTGDGTRQFTLPNKMKVYTNTRRDEVNASSPGYKFWDKKTKKKTKKTTRKKPLFRGKKK